jgi:hypothetical protein
LFGLYVGSDTEAFTCQFFGSKTITARESALKLSMYFFAIDSTSFCIQISIVRIISSQSFVLITSKSLHPIFRFERHVISQSIQSNMLSKYFSIQ